MSATLLFPERAIVPAAADWLSTDDWPHRAASRFVLAGGLRWHVQVLDGPARDAPVALLLHGTGASTHSWRELGPLLARRHTIIMPDLPGQGFSAMPPSGGLSLAGMATGITALLRVLDVRPDLIIGHSAGAALGARLCLDGVAAPERLISINGALLPLGGMAGMVFGPMARLMVNLPGLARFAARQARDRATVERLLRDTGSVLTPEGVDLYARLFRRPGHVAATLGMMAAWDLPGLARDLPRLTTPLTLIVGKQDRTIRPTEARRLQALLPTARIEALPGLGHLAHEEAPGLVARRILETA
ncbi:alpha/beta fold hydrolase BchO [Roseococcus suduntuyensis]|uniref:Magnesium chelatase accessory protein n=1 Tax=Roseococcus suduntuyensis TaxID=455361 RepID=A0A840ACP7_9PROT|nr:alpha/beta fold hydrolase BchO [Roseococcus suduntuyensis]MBB3898110.1 magnesium chelatase accessory protein [Roseococcus suduntuyensis]